MPSRSCRPSQGFFTVPDEIGNLTALESLSITARSLPLALTRLTRLRSLLADRLSAIQSAWLLGGDAQDPARWIHTGNLLPLGALSQLTVGGLFSPLFWLPSRLTLTLTNTHEHSPCSRCAHPSMDACRSRSILRGGTSLPTSACQIVSTMPHFARRSCASATPCPCRTASTACRSWRRARRCCGCGSTGEVGLLLVLLLSDYYWHVCKQQRLARQLSSCNSCLRCRLSDGSQFGWTSNLTALSALDLSINNFTELPHDLQEATSLR